jgi:hypothetical protein
VLGVGRMAHSLVGRQFQRRAHRTPAVASSSRVAFQRRRDPTNTERAPWLLGTTGHCASSTTHMSRPSMSSTHSALAPGSMDLSPHPSLTPKEALGGLAPRCILSNSSVFGVPARCDPAHMGQIKSVSSVVPFHPLIASPPSQLRTSTT